MRSLSSFPLSLPSSLSLISFSHILAIWCRSIQIAASYDIARRRDTNQLSSLHSKLAWGTTRTLVKQSLNQTRDKRGKLTESPQNSPFLFVNSVSPAHGLDLIASLQPTKRLVTCWNASVLSWGPFRL